MSKLSKALSDTDCSDWNNCRKTLNNIRGDILHFSKTGYNHGLFEIQNTLRQFLSTNEIGDEQNQKKFLRELNTLIRVCDEKRI